MPRPLLTSTSNPRIRETLKLRQGRDRRSAGLFIAEGVREIERALAGKLELSAVFWCPRMLRSRDDTPPGVATGLKTLDRLIDRDRVDAFPVSVGVMHKLAYRENPEGVLAVFRTPTRHLQTLRPRRSSEALWLVAVGPTKPGNVGAMARTAEGMGADGLIVTDGRIDAFNPNAIRASTGAVFSLPLVSASGEMVRPWLERQGVRVFAAALEGATACDGVDLTGPAAIVIGAEDEGLNREWLDWAAAHGTIVQAPMVGELVDSLNASVAAGVLLYEVTRQRRAASRAAVDAVD